MSPTLTSSVSSSNTTLWNAHIVRTTDTTHGTSHEIQHAFTRSKGPTQHKEDHLDNRSGIGVFSSESDVQKVSPKVSWGEVRVE